MVAIILMLTGIGLIGSVTASVASQFIQQVHEEEEKKDQNRVKLELIQYIQTETERVDQLTNEEYQTLLSMLDSLRKQDSSLSHKPGKK